MGQDDDAPKAEKADKVKEARADKVAPGFVPPIILRNKGVPITLYRLENGELPALEDEEADRPTRTLHLRFNANNVADIEEAFDVITARVPVVERTVKLDGEGNPLEGPAGPVYEEKVIGHEDRNFYGLDAFQQAMEVRMTGTVRKVIAIALGWPVEQAGLAMIPEQAQEYQTAVGVAWAIAQGVDPTDAAKILAKGLAAVGSQRDALASRLEKMTGQDEE